MPSDRSDLFVIWGKTCASFTCGGRCGMHNSALTVDEIFSPLGSVTHILSLGLLLVYGLPCDKYVAEHPESAIA